MSDSVWPHRWQPIRLRRPWNSPGKNTGVDCYFLLQCMKVKSESEVTQSCLTLSNLMDCSLPGSSIHGILQARVLEWVAIAFSPVLYSRSLLITCFIVGFPCGSAGKESTCNVGDLGSIPRLGRSSREGQGYTLQYSGLENSMDCIVHGVTKNQTWLTFIFTFHFLIYSSVYMTIPVFQFTTRPPHLLPGNHKFVFSISSCFWRRFWITSTLSIVQLVIPWELRNASLSHLSHHSKPSNTSHDFSSYLANDEL